MAFVDKVAAATKAHLHDIIYVSSDSMQPGLDQRDQSWSGFVNGRYGGCQTSHTSYIGPRSAGVVSPAMSGGWSGGWSLCERSIPGDPARNQIELVDLIHNRYEIGTEPSLVRGSAATQIRQQEAQMRHEQASGQLHSAGLTSVDGHRALRLVTRGSPGLQYLVDPHSYLLLEFISPGTSRVATLHGRQVNVTGPDFVQHYQYLAPTAANAALLWQAPPTGATRLAFPPCNSVFQCDTDSFTFQTNAVVGTGPGPAAAKPHHLGSAHR